MSHTSAAQAVSAADAVIAQAQALMEYRNAVRHVGTLQQFMLEETARRQSRLAAARQKLIDCGGGHIVEEIEAAQAKGVRRV